MVQFCVGFQELFVIFIPPRLGSSGGICARLQQLVNPEDNNRMQITERISIIHISEKGEILVVYNHVNINILVISHQFLFNHSINIIYVLE